MARARVSISRPQSPGSWSVPASLPVQAAAGRVLQDQVAHPLVFADLVDLHDVGVLEPGRGLGLGLEPGGRAGVGVSAARGSP